MSWIAEYLLLPVLLSRFTAFGRSMLRIITAIRHLIPGGTAEPKGLQEQMKVTHYTCMLTLKGYFLLGS